MIELKKMTRLEANRQLLYILEDLIEEHEDLRFGQILQAFAFIKTNRADASEVSIDWKNEFYLESKDLYERVKQRVKDIEGK